MNEYSVVLFKSVHHAMKAEIILKKKDLIIKLIPVPKYISSDCGVCIRFLTKDRNEIEESLKGEVEILDVKILVAAKFLK